MTELEVHPFFEQSKGNYNNIAGGFFPEGMIVLAVGTFPPKKNYFNEPHYFYYPSPKSHFWNKIDSIFSKTAMHIPLKKTSCLNAEESTENNSRRKRDFARQHHLGFVDVFTHINRKVEGSTKDKDLIPVHTISENGLLSSLITDFPDLKRICCMYSLAFDQILASLPQKHNLTKVRDLKTDSGIKTANEFRFMVNGIEIMQLYPASRSGHKREEKIRQYAHYLFDISID